MISISVIITSTVEETALGMLALISLVWGASAPGFRHHAAVYY